MATSQNGFLALESGSFALHKWVIPGTNRTFNMRGGSAGFILAHFILWFSETVERIGIGIWDDWGYAYRPVRSSTDLSNHSSGTAVDLNATKHPLGAVNTFKIKAKLAIQARLLMYAGTIRWGGDYFNRKDEMHFEINASLSKCERVAKRLMKTKRGKRILAANPGQKAVILS